MPDKRCQNLSVDRASGKYWEREFCVMAYKRGKIFTPHQWQRSESAVAYGKHFKFLTLPDVTIWSSPGEHHEIKNKNPSKRGYYGLEKYRIDALVEFDKACIGDVLYTIHNWEKAGLKNGKQEGENRIEDWFCSLCHELYETPDYKNHNDTSWVNGVQRTDIEIWYWEAERFYPLSSYWGITNA